LCVCGREGWREEIVDREIERESDSDSDSDREEVIRKRRERGKVRGD